VINNVINHVINHWSIKTASKARRVSSYRRVLRSWHEGCRPTDDERRLLAIFFPGATSLVPPRGASAWKLRLPKERGH